MCEKKRTEICGLMPNGEWVHLGNVKMSQEDKQSFLGHIAQIYGSGKTGWFNVGPAMFDASKFYGVRAE